MAITTAVYKKNISNVGVWSGSDVIDQLEQAFTGLGWNSQDDQGGYIVGLSTWLGGGSNPEENSGTYYVEGYHSGLGTGAKFQVHRDNSGNLVDVAVNHSGYGYTGGELITIPAESINAPVGQDLVVRPYVHSVMNGAVSYAISCTHTSGSDFAVEGTDRNGVVSGAYTTITIKEGDTITFNNVGSFSGIDLFILRGTHNTLYTERDDLVANVKNQNAQHNGGSLVWTPLRGQAGEYSLRDSNYYLGSGQYEQTTIIVQPAQDNDVTYPVIGTTTGFYDKNLLAIQGDYPYGVMRNVIQSGKKKGITFSAFQIHNNDASEVCYAAGPHWFPFNYTDTVDESDYTYKNSEQYRASGGHGYAHRWAGEYGVDVCPDGSPFRHAYSYMDPLSNCTVYSSGFTYNSATSQDWGAIETGNNTTFQLDLNVFRSGIDPNFAVLSFRAPTLSATNINGNTFGTFFLHKFTTSVWDLDNVFLGGHTQILRETNTNTAHPYINFRTFLNGTYDGGNYSWGAAGGAEVGYASVDKNNTYDKSQQYIETFYNCTTHPYDNDGANYGYAGGNVFPYYRNQSNLPEKNGRVATTDKTGTELGSVADSNAVIKGLPINAMMMPVPYYLPDDFVMIQFYYGSVNANIQQGDTITISPTEIYTVIAGSYNMTTDNVTRGILFCGRKV